MPHLMPLITCLSLVLFVGLGAHTMLTDRQTQVLSVSCEKVMKGFSLGFSIFNGIDAVNLHWELAAKYLQ